MARDRCCRRGAVADDGGAGDVPEGWVVKRGVMAAAFLAAFASAFMFTRSGQSEDVTTVAIRFSRFEPAVVAATAGEAITLRLRNDDPIGHEWIVGSEAIHERHRTGTEPYHDACQ